MDSIVKRWETRHEIKLFIEESLDPDIEYFMQEELTPRMAEVLMKFSKMRNHLVEMTILSKKYG